MDSNSTLLVGESGAVSLTLNPNYLLIHDNTVQPKPRLCGLLLSKAKSSINIPYYDILSAAISTTDLIIHYVEPSSNKDVRPLSTQYTITSDVKSQAESWVERLIDLAYGNAQRNKRLKVLINPFGGKGKAEKLYHSAAKPIFEAAGCQLDVQLTQYAGHATEIAKDLDVNAHDSIVCCSGDGLPYEVFNGLGKRDDATAALAKIAVAAMPCGSGNAMVWNLYGTASMSKVALAIVKGKRIPLDLASVTQGETRTLSFLSQSYGIVAESDLGTENIRWMGDLRFYYGFLVRFLGKTTYPCDVAVKVELDDKEDIRRDYAAKRDEKPALRPLDVSSVLPAGLPPLKYGTVHDQVPPDWMVLSSDVMGNFYAGNMAYMAANSNFFPAAQPSDGCLDLITIDGTISRLTSIQLLLSVAENTFFNHKEVVVHKISAYRLTPRNRKEGFISIDGEKVPFEPYQVEVHRGLGTVLSKSGHFYEAPGPA